MNAHDAQADQPIVHKRAFRREPCSIVIEGPDADGYERAVLVRDISRGGMGTALFWSWETGTEIDLKLYPEPTSDRMYKVRARVVWVKPGEPGSAGLQFTHCPQDFQEWLTQFLSEREGSQSEPSGELVVSTS